MEDVSVSSVLLYTQEMMLAVIEEQWTVLMEMQLIQDKMLIQLFSVDHVSFSDLETKDLVEVQRLNQEVLSAAQSHKAELANSLREIRQGKVKAASYLTL